jgi:hypothetical protein
MQELDTTQPPRKIRIAQDDVRIDLLNFLQSVFRRCRLYNRNPEDLNEGDIQLAS